MKDGEGGDEVRSEEGDNGACSVMGLLMDGLEIRGGGETGKGD